MVSADSPPKKARKTLGDLLLQSAQAQLQATDTAQRMRRLEDAAPADVPSPAALAPAAYPPPLPSPGAASRETPASPAPSPNMRSDMRSDWQPDQDSDNRSDDRPDERPDERTDAQPDERPDERTIEHAHARTPARSPEPTPGQSDAQSAARSAARPAAPSAARTEALSDALSGARSGDLLGVRTDVQSAAWSDIRFDARTDIRPVGHPTPAESLTPKQRDILAFLLTHRPRIINCMTIAAHVGGTEDSVRSILNRLRKNGFLTFGKTKIGAMQGLVFRYNEALCATLDEIPHGDRPGDLSDERTGARCNAPSYARSSARTDVGSGHLTDARSSFRTSAQTDVRPHARSSAQSHDGTDARSDWRSDRPPDMHHLDEKKEREDLSVSRARSPRAMLLALTDEDIAFFWPSLARVDFRRGQIAQIVERLESLGGSLADVRKSLDHADFELGAGPLLDARGAPVADPRAYVFHAIAKTGYYRRPPGYVSAQEQAELDAAEEARRLAKARAEREEAEFQTWKMSLDPRALLALLEGRRGPEEVWLRTKWREQRRAAEG